LKRDHGSTSFRAFSEITGAQAEGKTVKPKRLKRKIFTISFPSDRSLRAVAEIMTLQITDAFLIIILLFRPGICLRMEMRFPLLLSKICIGLILDLNPIGRSPLDKMDFSYFWVQHKTKNALSRTALV
jgi:hypothetical protein